MAAGDRTSRLDTLTVSVAVLLAFAIFAIPLGSYWLKYFPYEDDFSLLLFSARQHHPDLSKWVTEGYSRYFENDPACFERAWGFVRPFTNATHYLESWFAPSDYGLHLMITNILCFLISTGMVYIVARRLGAGTFESGIVVLVFAISPCWYRGLYHSTFRNNPLVALWSLAAFALILSRPAGRRWWVKWLAAGIVNAFCVATHDQGILTVAGTLVAGAYAGFNRSSNRQIGRAVIAAALLTLPPAIVLTAFRIASNTFGHNYVTHGLSYWNFPGLRTSAEVALHSAVKRVVTLFAPATADNPLAVSAVAAGALILIPLVTAVGILFRKDRGIQFAAAMTLLFAIPSAVVVVDEPRFRIMDSLWGMVLIACTLTAARRFHHKSVQLCAAISLSGVLVFNVVSYATNVVGRSALWTTRNEVDRTSFLSIQRAIASDPRARMVLVNEQMGTWAARSMLTMAGAGDRQIEILPTIAREITTDFLPGKPDCGVITSFDRSPLGVDVRMRYSSRCKPMLFGIDRDCLADRYQAAGLAGNEAWARCVTALEYCSPIRHEVRLQPGESAWLLIWDSRFEPVRVVHWPPAP